MGVLARFGSAELETARMSSLVDSTSGRGGFASYDEPYSALERDSNSEQWYWMDAARTDQEAQVGSEPARFQDIPEEPTNTVVSSVASVELPPRGRRDQRMGRKEFLFGQTGERVPNGQRLRGPKRPEYSRSGPPAASAPGGLEYQSPWMRQHDQQAAPEYMKPAVSRQLQGRLSLLQPPDPSQHSFWREAHRDSHPATGRGAGEPSQAEVFMLDGWETADEPIGDHYAASDRGIRRAFDMYRGHTRLQGGRQPSLTDTEDTFDQDGSVSLNSKKLSPPSSPSSASCFREKPATQDSFASAPSSALLSHMEASETADIKYDDELNPSRLFGDPGNYKRIVDPVRLHESIRRVHQKRQRTEEQRKRSSASKAAFRSPDGELMGAQEEYPMQDEENMDVPHVTVEHKPFNYGGKDLAFEKQTSMTDVFSRDFRRMGQLGSNTIFQECFHLFLNCWYLSISTSETIFVVFLMSLRRRTLQSNS
ncbi:unnamed protein product [Protopolystoma xenopodis]|uniref:Uncharacterized protein n=1 Tax=Protopolystoma xenopodis TaxID=117903 RepID=A0A448WWN1_9PLAT|nr:unnamed protein product [Protopolystoma xenopodis]